MSAELTDTYHHVFNLTCVGGRVGRREEGGWGGEGWSTELPDIYHHVFNLTCMCVSGRVGRREGGEEGG